MQPEVKLIYALLAFGLSACAYTCSKSPDYEFEIVTPEDVRSFIGRLSTTEWDKICLLYPYNSKSNLPNLSDSTLRNLRYKPGDWYVEENQTGLIVINTRLNQGTVYVFPRKIVGRIEGPECIDRPETKISYAPVTYRNGVVQVLALQQKP